MPPRAQVAIPGVGILPHALSERARRPSGQTDDGLEAATAHRVVVADVKIGEGAVDTLSELRVGLPRDVGAVGIVLTAFDGDDLRNLMHRERFAPP